jgi:thioredoxin 1
MAVKQLSLENFEEEVFNSDVPIIIDFYADWCGPCQMMKPVFESLSSEYDGKLKFMKLDTQVEEGLAMKFMIQGIPALVMVKGDKEIGRIVGYRDEESLRQEINNLLEKVQ